MILLPRHFRHRLALLFGTLALLVGLPSTLYINQVYHERLIADRGQSLHDLANAVAAVVGENLQERQREISLLAQTPLFREQPLDAPAIRDSLGRLQASYASYSWIGLADTAGRVRNATGDLLVGAEVNQRPWFQRGLTSAHIGDVHEALLLSKFLPPPPDGRAIRFIDFTAPVHDAQGQVRAVLGAHAHWDWAEDVIQVLRPAQAAQQGLDIFIVNRRGQIIYPEGDGLPAAVPGELAVDPPFVTVPWDGAGPYLSTLAQVPEVIPEDPLGWSIAVRQPRALALAEVQDLQMGMLLFVALTMLVFAALAWWSAARFSRPLDHLVGVAQRLERGDLAPPPAVATWASEFQALAHAFLAMGTTLIRRRDELARFNAGLEAEVARRTAEAEAASAAKSEFLAHMSHEIRTPMNAVLGLTQLLNRQVLSAEQRDMVQRIQGAGQSLLGILNDILDFSKIEAGQLRLEDRPFHLDALLAKLDSLLGHVARGKGLTLRIAGPDAALGPLRGDALRLEQILINLVGNAIKFTEAGEVAVTFTTLANDPAGVRLRCAVRDTGIGIGPEALARLFSPFTQADASTTRRFGGTGLGLSICKRLVELMGGTLGAESVPGEGSTFWCELPFSHAGDEEVAAPAAPVAKPPVGPRLRGLRLLAVDDSALNRDLVERALKLEGAQVSLAGDGQQALLLLQASPAGFDAVLMDVQMPVMDGLTAMRRIRADLGLKALPLLALTAGVLPEQQEAAREAGADAVLAKPLDLDHLVTTLRERVGPAVLARAAAQAAAQASLAAPAATGAPERPATGGDFPLIAGIDRVRAALSVDQDRDFFLLLLGRFVDDAATAVADTRAWLADGDRERATRRVHSLRGNAGNLGALGIMTHAATIEEALRQTGQAREEDLDRLERQLADLAAASAPWLSAAALSAQARQQAESQVEADDEDPAAERLVEASVEGPCTATVVAPASSSASTTPSSHQPGEPGMQPAAKILIVDDEPTAIQVLRKALKDMGELRYAISGQEALDLVASDPPDLILLDANMPGMDGYATCRALQEDYPDIPVVFVTASGDFADEIRALKAGASDFITKPINPPVVRARVAMHLKFKTQGDLLRDLSHRDPLTGIANRRALDERLVQEWRRAQRHHQPLALLMIDIDHFKGYNDHYGHIQGDDCLTRVAEAIAGLVNRAGDLVARYGGEEFAVLLAHTRLHEAQTLAERIRATIEALAIPHAASSTGPVVTLSIGVAECQPTLPGRAWPSSAPLAAAAERDPGLHLAKDLFDRADQALYAAKQAGRNRTALNPVSG
jgi:diguanylate cyclase (GGDEF)-like protein